MTARCWELLYDATGGPDWTDSRNWKTDAPLAEWFGVTTDADGRVTALKMNGNGLVGLIPAELGSLENLEGTVSRGQRVDGAESRTRWVTSPTSPRCISGGTT